MNETQGYVDHHYSSVTDKSHVHTGIAQSVVFKIIIQDLRFMELKCWYGCLSSLGRGGGFPSVRANDAPK